MRQQRGEWRNLVKQREGEIGNSSWKEGRRQCGKSEGRREEEDTFWTLGGEEGREGGRGREEMQGDEGRQVVLLRPQKTTQQIWVKVMSRHALAGGREGGGAKQVAAFISRGAHHQPITRQHGTTGESYRYTPCRYSKAPPHHRKKGV